MPEKVIKHYGTKRHSGRYPWGSGGNANQNDETFLSMVSNLRDKGLSEVERAKALGMNTRELRDKISLANKRKRQADATRASRLREKGYSYVAIGEKMGINESSVRSLLKPKLRKKNKMIDNTVDMLKKEVAERKYIDVGVGTEHHIGISRNKLKTALAALEKEGYEKHYVQVEQLGVPGNKTSVMVLAPPGTPWKEVNANKGDISVVQHYTEDGGLTMLNMKPPKSVDSKRVAINYKEDGGAERDGLIEVRRGKSDISLGNAKYAQVRIAVDDSHYLKGMAMYSDDLPDGVDLRFNTNKSKKDGKKGVMKELKDDKDNPFGATVAQRHYIDKDGNKKLSPINIVNEEGDWATWSKNLSTQMLSKQPPVLAKKQLERAYKRKEEEYDEILSLTNPTVKQKLLEAFGDGAEAASVHMKAAAMPRQNTNVLLPFSNIKDDEIYAPNYRNGENVVLIRYPHGGRFEIPQLKVNNNYESAKEALKGARDAVGINSKVAERMSGADFDGDTVLVIPNNKGQVKVSNALKGLKDFDPSANYPAPEGMKKIKKNTRNTEMGKVSNLITDMTIKGASQSEIARAVRHSMVVIDSHKHYLDYKQSYEDNAIGALTNKYQDGGGASTIISKASSEVRVPTRKTKLDPKTGKKIIIPKEGDTYVDSKGRLVRRTQKSKKMLEVEDARELSSGTTMEAIYATHANKMKGLARDARKKMLNTKHKPYSKSARKAYQKEVDSLKAKLNLAKKNKPLERKAQLVANENVKKKRKANPDMEYSNLKRLKGQALASARNRVGAKKQTIDISTKEWEAIQAGAVSKTRLKQILNNSDLDRVKELATPRAKRKMTSSKINKAQTYLNRGHTRAQVADKLGVSISTLDRAME